MADFLYHTNCNECGSSDALAIYEGGTGYCWSCETYVKTIEDIEGESTVSEKVKKPVTIPEYVSKLKAQTLPERFLKKETLERFGVRVRADSEGKDLEHYYPYFKDGQLVAYKVRNTAEKQFRILGQGKDLPLFGSHLYKPGGKLIILTEGEIDCLSVYQLLKLKNKNYCVVSLPSGANTKSLKSSENYDFLDSFNTIMLCLDQDEPGKKTATQISEIFGAEKVEVMSFSEKDANDLLTSRKAKEFFNSLYKSRSQKPDGIVSVDELIDDALQPVADGLPWPWEPLTKFTFGRRRREIYGFGAGSGCGKTEGFKEIIHHVINVDQLMAGVIFLEEDPTLTIKAIAGKSKGKRFHIPGENWTFDELRDALLEMKGKVFLYRHFGGKDWDTVKRKIRYMVSSLGIKDIFLDHLTALIAKENDEMKAMNRIMEELASLSQELDCTIYFISHLRKSTTGTPHEEGGRVTQADFRGSGALAYWSHFLFGYERNTQSPNKKERNTTTFRCIKDRYTGLSTGETFQLYFDHDKGKWTVIEREEDEIEDFDNLEEDVL